MFEILWNTDKCVLSKCRDSESFLRLSHNIFFLKEKTKGKNKIIFQLKADLVLIMKLEDAHTKKYILCKQMIIYKKYYGAKHSIVTY